MTATPDPEEPLPVMAVGGVYLCGTEQIGIATIRYVLPDGQLSVTMPTAVGPWLVTS